MKKLKTTITVYDDDEPTRNLSTVDVVVEYEELYPNGEYTIEIESVKDEYGKEIELRDLSDTDKQKIDVLAYEKYEG